MRKIVIGSRRSNLALTQTNWVIEQLSKLGLPYEFEVKEILTKGDRILDVTLSKVGGKGLFVKEIEQALHDKEIDLAVHSMKDVPSVLEDGFTLGAITEREDARDVLLSKDHVKFADLPAGATLGTSSLRRSAQLLAARPDLKVKWIRGNVETRMQKLADGEFDAIILAAAGLKRLGFPEDTITEYLDPVTCVPAVGQGALGLECRIDDEDVMQLLSHINDDSTARAVTAERTFLNRMEGGCQVPIAGYATVGEGDSLSLTILVGSPDGEILLKETVNGNDPVALGEEGAARLLDQGAKDILDKVKDELEKQ
ncbi:hydroxymethylbilane synthase [bacterium LRH843]|nr:hydroxymethylbilane synthase [bacterium LRH843]